MAKPATRSGRAVGGLRVVALLAILMARPSAAVTLVHRPYLQNMTQSRVTVVWSTRENLTGMVQYSTDQSFSQSAAARLRPFPSALTGMSITFYQYQADLVGLLPATDYYYRVIVDGQNLTPEVERRFRTAAPGPFSFLVFGDSGLGTPEQQTLALRMASEQPNLVLHVGDIAYESGTYEEFQANYFEYYWTLMRRAPFFPVAGNHEYMTAESGPYLALHSPPTDTVPIPDRGKYYSFDWGDVHFVALDSDLLAYGSRAEPMLNWLDNDLRSTTARWRVAYFHHLPYPISHHVGDPVCALTRTRFVPILEKYDVQLVLTGHEHNYQRSLPMRGDRPVAGGMGTTYITTGGGGGVPHPVVPKDFLATAVMVYHYLRVEADANEITVHAIGQDGKEFDKVTLSIPSVSSTAAIVNSASFTTSVAPGGLISIFGRGLAAQTATVTGFPLPTTLGGTTVSLDGTAVPLIFVSTDQINAQLPLDAKGNMTLRVETAGGVSDVPITVVDTAPAIFPGGVLHATGTPVGSGAPAQPRETLMVFATGLGAVDRPIAAGQPATASPLLNVVSPVVVEIGEIPLNPIFAGLTPGLAGVYQVNVVLPPDLPPRSYNLRLSVKGLLSNPLPVLVQGR